MNMCEQRILLEAWFAGGVAAVLVAQLMTGVLYGLTPADPVTLLSVAALVLAVALVSCYLPARRAVAVDQKLFCTMTDKSYNSPPEEFR